MDEKVHTIGGYEFTLVPLTNRRRDALNKICGGAGVKDIADFVERFADELTSLQPRSEFILPFIDLIVDFYDKTIFHALLRRAKMLLRRQTKLTIIDNEEVTRLKEVADDFFVAKLCILHVSAQAHRNMVSSFRKTSPRNN